ncbi:hypothetical protein PVAND_008781 [Polypedilum vanderplanki]|uniref:Peptidase S1 domain-containing protein n=1 Tax=Polypedilum vanderplanki TaxID=319348 RepID=A0A9J6CAW2_POLVA|nr:hypothetical protein PVAND_008781 [Polypedilum vanderplanki]
MVVLKSFFLIILILSIFKNSLAQHITKCDSTTTFTVANQVSTVNWPETGNRNTFCTYIFKAPHNHFFKASISYNLAGTAPACSNNQYVAVSIDNMPNWEGYTRLCGTVPKTSPQVFQSIANELKIGIASNDFTKYVNITIESLPVHQGNCDCSWNPKTRIINGVDAGKNEFIAHVGFKAKVGSFDQSFCGGTIITPHHAITAAHCIVNIHKTYGMANVIMRAGSQNITAPLASDTVYAEEYKLIEAVHHEKYNNPQNANDIGIVKTSTYIRFTRGVGPACLPFSYKGYQVPNNTPLTAVGFGSTEFALDAAYDTNSWILKKVVLYSNSSLAKDCTSEVICTIGPKTGYTRGDSCTRDSGGPVYAYMKNRYFDFGVISRGIDCGGVNSYSYNMYIVSYFDWINTKTSNAFLCNLS